MNLENNNSDHKIFVSSLELLYGKFDFDTNKFEATSNSKIARDLCYSDSQFSRLINNSASDGEFKRALHNVNRLLNEKRLEKQEHTPTKPLKGKSNKRLILFLVGSTTVFLCGILYMYFSKSDTLEPVTEHSPYAMLQWSFENKYIKPYVKLKELPEDCNYPCYKYQGKWVLKSQYKIPFFRERNGFHYIAKEAVMYARSMEESSTDGTAFEGYEYQLHEIWYDKRELPIDSFLSDTNKTKIKDSYNNSDLSKDENFVKLADVHTFFRNEFSIDSSVVSRNGKAIGRNIEFLDENVLIEKLGSLKLANELMSEVNAIAKNRLEDFSKPVNCMPADLPKVDFHYVDEGDELAFKCQFSTGRFLVDYEKIFVLDDQYINNMCR